MASSDSTAVEAPAELRADAARNRASIVAVAREQVAAGDLTLAMNGIAKLAGVGVGTIYRHFPTRQTLLETAVEDSLAAIAAEARTAAGEDDPAVALRRLLLPVLRLLLADPGLAAILAVPVFECSRTIELGAELMSAVGAVLDRARAAGVIRADVTPDDLRRLMCGMQFALRAGTDAQEQLDRYGEFLLAGVRPVMPTSG
jgi:AcrR family transcriptional regulator